ncbi:MAG TPA: pyrroline-5-carboxylate reductase [Acidimicrobiales bacterium]|nr:pyrroline-5-carboxylate reductase [Acidimicrobiales bacterium]
MGLRLVIVGGGKMGSALVAGLVGAHWAGAEQLAVVEPIAARRDELGRLHPGLAVTAEVPGAEGAVLAVKPSDVAAACAGVAGAGIARVLSIVAGVGLDSLQSALGDDVAVVRAMPNTPALVGAGAAAIAGGPGAREADLDWADGILSAVGLVVRVGEPLLDAVTGLSGSGPAYVFYLAEALIEAGVLNGLTRDVSRALVVQTILGSARLLDQSGQSAGELRAAVTSPGGTTAAGVRALEAAAVRSAVLEAVTAAAERSRELGRG